MESKKVRRSLEERTNDIDRRIQEHKDAIAKLSEKKEAMLNPQPRKRAPSIRSAIEAAKAQGLSPEEIFKKLGLS